MLGLVSLFTDISSQMIYPLLPIFLSSVLGASTSFIGLIEGIAESTASFVRVFSGWFSDKLKKRKPIVFWGYTLSTIGKPFLYLATAPWHVLAVRFIDRVGKGVRTPPRDALIADSSRKEEIGRAFGFQRAMDRMGAFLGPLAAFMLLPILNNDMRLVFLLAFIPGVLAVLIIVFCIKEKAQGENSPVRTVSVSLKYFDSDFKKFVVILGIFTLGNSSEAFLILRAKDLGVTTVMIPVIWLMYNFVSSIVATPLGGLSDRIGRRKTTILGFLVFSFVYFGFAFSDRQSLIWFFMAVYGIYFGLSEGVLRAYVTDLVEDKSRLATAYGVFNTVIGLCMFPASFFMGILWQYFGAPLAFSFGAVLSLISAAALILLIKK